MTNLGLKIVGEEMEVGFTVSSRAEFDEAVERLTTMAQMLWMKQHEPEPDREMPPGFDLQSPALQKQERDAMHRWRESQGLR